MTIRKVPTDLTESSTCGTFLTILCYVTVAALIGFEFSNYLTVESIITCVGIRYSKNRLYD